MNTFNASPTKEFFIDMLTRDIFLDRAILDLVDNSIDGARNDMIRKKTKKKVNELFKGYKIEITLNQEEFIIKDNCGGFSKKAAGDYVFRIGKPNLQNDKEFQSIGRFGVGMKRALFKMGDDFWVESKHEKDHIIVKQNVTNWKTSIDDEDSESKWSFEFSEIQSKTNKLTPFLNEEGTLVKVTNLNQNVKRDFGINSFRNRLRDTIKRTYNYCIHKGLTILFNKKKLDAEPISLLYKKDQLEPYFQEYESDGVIIKIYAGIGEPDPSKAGWYIFCNDRLMVEKDKTNLTGWEGGDKFFKDTGVQKFHNKVAMFRGLVFMYSNDASKLPMTTTKTGIDYNSAIYTEMRSKMVVTMKIVLAKIRKVSSSEQRTEIAEQSDKVDVLKLKTNDLEEKFEFEIMEVLKPESSGKKMTKIEYHVETETYKIVKKALKVGTREKVGKETFNYFVDMKELS